MSSCSPVIEIERLYLSVSRCLFNHWVTAIVPGVVLAEIHLVLTCCATANPRVARPLSTVVKQNYWSDESKHFWSKHLPTWKARGLL